MASGKGAEAKARLVDVCVGGQGPLQAAARMGRLDVVKCMVKELGFDINVGSSETGVTALHAAALDGKLDTVRYLLDNGADPNKIDVPGEVPLHCAAKYGILSTSSEGHDEVAKLLLSRGVIVDRAYSYGTPLHIAAFYGKTNVMKVLLEHHADCGAMPIEIAAGRGRRKHVEMLFPFTSPIQTVSKWTVDGIIDHAKAKHSKHSKPKVEQHDKSTKEKVKLDGDKAVGRKDYLAASKLYGEAIDLDPADATLYSDRSFCLLRIGEATKALSYASSCIKMRPEWLKGYYRKGASIMSLK
ncbi:hypothetical protein BAE44_0017234, partial [Dichanthelium oligosanthes]